MWWTSLMEVNFSIICRCNKNIIATPSLSPLKITLGIVCAIYDMVLLYQHYVLYGPKPPKPEYTSIKDSNSEPPSSFDDLSNLNEKKLLDA
jgi:hypothetical protein